MSDDQRSSAADEQPPIDMKTFLETTPPSRWVSVSPMTQPTYPAISRSCDIQLPDISLHCDNAKCGGDRLFRTETASRTSTPAIAFDWNVKYWCSSCLQTTKVFSLRIEPTPGTQGGRCYKYGEFPPFRLRVPSRLISLVRRDRDLFVKGMQSEIQGLGIAAFGYYRRVVENQRTRVVAEIAKAAKALGADNGVIEAIHAAGEDIHFSSSVEKLEPAIPEALKINGHNPLRLLHAVLSKGLHADTDEQCLKKAQSIRTVLTELAERLSHVLKDRQKVDEAVNDLLNSIEKKPNSCDDANTDE